MNAISDVASRRSGRSQGASSSNDTEEPSPIAKDHPLDLLKENGKARKRSPSDTAMIESRKKATVSTEVPAEVSSPKEPRAPKEPKVPRDSKEPRARRGICIHGRSRYFCKECSGHGMCMHGKQKRFCRICDGGSLCPHEKNKYKCKDCGGSSLCICGRERAQCSTCGGLSDEVLAVRKAKRRDAYAKKSVIKLTDEELALRNQALPFFQSTMLSCIPVHNSV